MKTRISDAMKTAMKSGDKRRLGIIRLMLAGIKQKEVDGRIELDDAAVIDVLAKMVKQRNESISQYKAANRDDLVEQEAFELTVIDEFLPAALSDAEIEAAIDKAIQETGATSIKDMGKVMGILKTELTGRADMGAVSGKIKARLS